MTSTPAPAPKPLTCSDCGFVLPTETDVVHQCDLDEVRSRCEAATAKRIAEWLRGDYPIGMRNFVSSVAHNAADAIERGDWRKR